MQLGNQNISLGLLGVQLNGFFQIGKRKPPLLTEIGGRTDNGKNLLDGFLAALQKRRSQQFIGEIGVCLIEPLLQGAFGQTNNLAQITDG